MCPGVTETDECPFATGPDMTGCDCSCMLPPPKGFWRWVKWLLDPMSHVCVSGPGGCGNGKLPCGRFTEYKRRQTGRTGDVA